MSKYDYTMRALALESQVDELFTDNTRLKEMVHDLQEDNERLRKDRADALNVKSSDGLLSSEWLWRTGRAERKQMETEAENERLRDALQMLVKWYGVDTEQCNDPECYQCKMYRKIDAALKEGDE